MADSMDKSKSSEKRVKELETILNVCIFKMYKLFEMQQ